MLHFKTTAAILLCLTAFVTFADETDDRQLLEDCRLEGSAAGLRGAALADYISECVEDFKSTEISTNVQLPKQSAAH